MQPSSIDGDLILMIFINHFFEMQMYHFKLFGQILILKIDFISDAVFRVVYCLYQQLCYTIFYVQEYYAKWHYTQWNYAQKFWNFGELPRRPSSKLQ